MKKKIEINQRVTPTDECGCGNAAEDHGHKHGGSAGGGCCCHPADHANPASQHEEGCCGGSHVSEASQNADGLSVPDKGIHP